MVEVSVVIPTYNRADVLGRSIKSALDQTFDDMEIIVIDDCSTDNTKKVVQSFEDHRLKYVSHNVNKGGGGARNTGIRVSNGQYIAFLDSDDEWLPQKIEQQYNLFEDSSDEFSVIYTGHYVKDSNGQRIGTLPEEKGDIYKKQLLTDQVNPTSTVMAKRACLLDVGGFDQDLPARQDYDLWLRLSERYLFDFIKEPLVIQHSDCNNRISSNYDRRMEANITMLNKVKARIADHSKVEKRKILSSQYQSISGFSYISKEYRDAHEFALRSILQYPIGFKKWALATLSILRIPPDNPTVLNTKVAIGKLKQIFGAN